MSSAEEDFNDVENSSALVPDSKKRRVQRACDTCRRKKIRCDGSQMPGNRCSNCIAYSFECTYVEAAKKRGPPKGYVEGLENRLEKMEKLLQKVCPDADFSQELGGGRIDRETWQKGNAGASTSGHTMNATSTSYGNLNAPLETLVPSDDEDIVPLRLCEGLKSMSLSPQRNKRFFGKSSGAMLVQRAIDLKKEVTGTEESTDRFFRPLDPGLYPWELASRNNVENPEYVFPDDDLGKTLIDLYFAHLNPLAPILHRPTFERKITQGVHLRNPAFGSVYLLVCASAARFSDDPRVFLDGLEAGLYEKSAGWMFFEQVQMVKGPLFGPPCLEDLQTYCLFILYLQGTSTPQACWAIVGIGIRLAQDVGAHRRKSYDGKPSVEGELWKRAFWALVVFDRQMSSSLGRPCAIHDEDFDLDFPVDCDDEYWEHPDPEQAFKQPSDKPSTASFFISFIKLNNILSFAHRTIYSINKSKILLGFVGQQWEQHIVAELDSSLNKWIDEVPDHLRWDPTRDARHSPFFMQSSGLYTFYYYVQIFIHRPFIPSPRKPSPLSFPSLAICTNAARSCSHVIDIYRRRSPACAFFLQMQAFTAGIVLLLNIWGGKQSGLSIDPLKEMADVHKCMGLLKTLNRWHSCGRLWEILYELASVGDLPLPQPSPQGGTKRERDSHSPISSARSLPTPTESPRAIAGTRRVSREQQQPRPQPPPPSQPGPSQPAHLYNLPVYSNDLGRLPLHGQVDFSTAGSTSQPSSNMWYSVTSGTQPPPPRQQQPSNLPPPPMAGHGGFASHGTEGYAFDNMFMDSMSSSFGAFSAQHAHVHNAGASDLQAYMDPTTTATMMQPNAAGLDVDPDTIAMWSCAPAGFGVNDWGTYLMNVSGSGTGQSRQRVS